MKKYWFFPVLLFNCFLLPFVIPADSYYTLSGKIKGADGRKIYLISHKNDILYKDSVSSSDGSFMFSGAVSNPYLYSLAVEGTTAVIPVFLENSKITVIAYIKDYGAATITGSKEHDIYRQFRAILQKEIGPSEVVKQHEELQKQKDSANMKRISDQWNSKGDSVLAQLKAFFKSHRDNYVTGYGIQSMVRGPMKDDERESLYNILSDRIKASEYGNQIRQKMETESMLGIGKKAPDFVQNQPDGKQLRLSSLKGKYVLVDFWASWCKPCRAENPNIVKAYLSYKDKGLDIVGVSLDQPGGKDAWLKAIKDDNLTWHQVSDLMFWDNAVAVQYNIKSIPYNLLLDPNGIIVGRNLKGKDLQQKLASLPNK
jgi:peroxiredoxin